MPTLSVTEFSCLKEAAFSLAPVTVIIGPQGSGKSVTTKLFYFFADVLNNFTLFCERGDSLEDYKRYLAKQFAIWFPPSAWGGGRFNISYTAGPFSMRILRRQRQGKLSDEVAITFSEWFPSLFETATNLYQISQAEGREDAEEPLVSASLERSWRVRDSISSILSKEMGTEYLSQQTFIPAGRAFFTSIGRLAAGFEQAGSLDPVTIKFARLLVTIRDRRVMMSPTYVRRMGAEEHFKRRRQFMLKLFGGDLRHEGDVDYVETSDGRRIPFSSLSSGQQELFPMWSLIDYFAERDVVRLRRSDAESPRSRQLVYIEEPEAHLFPSAQSLLMEFLIGSIADKNTRSLVITTHSPYIMSKLNVFLKAGQLARRKKRNQEINSLVPRECWLNLEQVAAFSIEEGRLRSLIGEDDLIDATYLDSISEQIAGEFSDLLDLEISM